MHIVIIDELNMVLLNIVFAFTLNMVFNVSMNDKKIIISLGGPAKVAELLGLDKLKGGVQRVHNWLARGIPAKEKLKRPDLFLRGVMTVTATKKVTKKGQQQSRQQ